MWRKLLQGGISEQRAEWSQPHEDLGRRFVLQMQITLKREYVW